MPSSTALSRALTTLSALPVNLAGAQRSHKRVVAMMADAIVAVVTLWLAYSLRFGMPFSDFRTTIHLFALLPLLTVLSFGALGVYGWVVRSSNPRLYRQIAKGCCLVALSLLVYSYLFPPDRINPRSLFVIFGTLLLIGTCGLRLLWQEHFDVGKRGVPIAIYGAGEGGQLLQALLSGSAEYRPVVFIDDEVHGPGAMVAGLPVLDGAAPGLVSRLATLEVSMVVLAIPSLGGTPYREKLSSLSALGLTVRTIPSINELITGRARPDEIREVSVTDLLGRSEVLPDRALMGARVTGRSILVTGGGGSIGSELCRQILRLDPKSLTVLDQSEANLYAITEELGHRTVFHPRLGSICDAARLDRLFVEHAIDTVFHAAAYKHVPIVQADPDQGVRTNVFGTLTLVDRAIGAGVSDFVLISTDKAVRPANAMGASKRIAELILQARSRQDIATRLSIVRFGNVLGSSGSVVPKFASQIRAGGPVTLTDPNVTRFFMTITEAAQLVLQASAIARGGDVFVLDMGEAVRIEDLATTMIHLSGRSLRRDTGNPDDIEIIIEGLRPGEKMYEELFVGAEHRRTQVQRIFTADEAWLPWSELSTRLDRLSESVESGDIPGVREQIAELSTGVTQAEEIVKPDRRPVSMTRPVVASNGLESA